MKPLRPTIIALVVGMGSSVPADAYSQSTLPIYASAASPEEKAFLERQLTAFYAYVMTFSQAGKVGTADEAIRIIEAKIASDNERIRRLERDRRRHRNELDEARNSLRQLRLELTMIMETATKDALAADATLAAALASIRDEVEAASPEKLSALQRFADGDRVGANLILDELAEAARRGRALAAQARAEQTNRIEAQEWRAQAQRHELMLAQAEGGFSSTHVLREWEQVVLYSPQDGQAWFNIADLRWKIGDIGGAETAYEKSIEFASSTYEHLRAIDALLMIEEGRRHAGLSTSRGLDLERRYLAALGLDKDDQPLEPYRDTTPVGVDLIRQGQSYINNWRIDQISDPVAVEHLIHANIIVALGSYQQKNISNAITYLNSAQSILFETNQNIRAMPRLRFLILISTINSQILISQGNLHAAKEEALKAKNQSIEYIRLDQNTIYGQSLLERCYFILGKIDYIYENFNNAAEWFQLAADIRFNEFTKDTSQVISLGSWRESLEAYSDACKRSSMKNDCDEYLLSQYIILNEFKIDNTEIKNNLITARLNVLFIRLNLMINDWNENRIDKEISDLENIANLYLTSSSQDRYGFEIATMNINVIRGMGAQIHNDKSAAITHYTNALNIALKHLEDSKGLTPLSYWDNYRNVTFLLVSIALLDTAPETMHEAAFWLNEAIKSKTISPEEITPEVRAQFGQLLLNIDSGLEESRSQVNPPQD